MTELQNLYRIASVSSQLQLTAAQQLGESFHPELSRRNANALFDNTMAHATIKPYLCSLEGRDNTLLWLERATVLIATGFANAGYRGAYKQQSTDTTRSQPKVSARIYSFQELAEAIASHSLLTTR
jgi:hypothetical protein